MQAQPIPFHGHGQGHHDGHHEQILKPLIGGDSATGILVGKNGDPLLKVEPMVVKVALAIQEDRGPKGPPAGNGGPSLALHKNEGNAGSQQAYHKGMLQQEPINKQDIGCAGQQPHQGLSDSEKQQPPRGGCHEFILRIQSTRFVRIVGILATTRLVVVVVEEEEESQTRKPKKSEGPTNDHGAHHLAYD